MNKNHLSEKEQFKEILNQEEISRIENIELRDIRMKYWHLRHEAFLDEHNISDQKLEQIIEELRQKEMREVKRFRNDV
ncbi:hypothetical protein [Saccharibacillus deserti]|uniref:hypothetical protein n=1 Tax=Saccharibacillus deserti TaxID=1634444 RepID=UPI00155369B6|nr:hypothetical protein [Saccharibacillus deserti]